MKLRIFTCLILAALVTACPTVERKPKKGKGKYETEKPLKPTKDQSGDVSFQAFVGQLQTAIARKDLEALVPMMAPDFGYRWDTPPPNEDVFEYWERNGLWNELRNLVRESWVPYDGYMVVPPQLATDPEYRGYRAGAQQVNGSWRFSYFVPAPPAE